MWWVVCVVSLVTVRASAQFYHHYGYDGQGLDDYEDEASSQSSRPSEALTRVRRFGDGDIRMPNPQEIYDIKGAIKQLLPGRNVDFPTRSSSQFNTKLSKSSNKVRTVAERSMTSLRSARPPFMEQDWFRERAVLREHTSTTTIDVTVTTDISTSSVITTVTNVTPQTSSTTAVGSDTTTQSDTNKQSDTSKQSDTTTQSDASTNVPTTSMVSDMPATTLTTITTYAPKKTTPTVSTISSAEDKKKSSTTPSISSSMRTTTDKRSRKTTEPTTVTTETSGPKFDIEALLAIVANMTYDYDTNLTQELNETLQRFSIPTCEIPTTTTTITTTQTTTEMWYNTTVVSKCFVCGMDTHGIPRNTFCADAFATDFLPLVPINPRAKGHISRFRKYCKYFDVNNYQRNRSDPRAMLGRWTGGCAVRWVDLSTVYTQRTCRNRFRPTTGRHYGSKRMAKLELALANVDDGCVTSPMATLVPLSRGISLYARFHACVCSGNWCNCAIVIQQWTAWLWLSLLFVVEVVR